MAPGSDGALKNHTITNSNAIPKTSLYDPEDETIMVYDGSKNIYKLRISDNLVIGQKTIEAEAEVDMGTDYYVLKYPAALGLIAKEEYDSDEKSKLRGFNFEILRN